ncbi:S-adenosylmethionine carrier 1, chloroplastic/mitochondrial-like [Asparagus officinalis]|uniref:S-adenosylmethionine carrier 1, chloroplastic/mitochondrial-like n=1 Tax=Asparagus officinalis TaxID=4686 RepID=UPI00098E0B90|nr:S-adenosylmethionine carrier 1, chloroplastic/mitochondrial-like [Asparagus officinalis]
MEDEKPFNFVRILFDGIIAGGTAGVVVESVLYPIYTIMPGFRQATRAGRKIQWKGLYSELAGNLAGVLP